jgi:CheY-like chemotaxis protein
LTTRTPGVVKISLDAKASPPHGFSAKVAARCLSRQIIRMKTILIADDNSTSRELVRTILENAGFLVVEAGDGQEAVRVAREKKPDGVMLDLHMPGLDGFKVIQALRQDPQFAATPILALTASAMHGDRERAIALGFSGYLTKPIRLGALRAEIDKWLGAAQE